MFKKLLLFSFLYVCYIYYFTLKIWHGVCTFVHRDGAIERKPFQESGNKGKGQMSSCERLAKRALFYEVVHPSVPRGSTTPR